MSLERRESHVTSHTTKTKVVPDDENCVIAEMPVPVRREESQTTQQLAAGEEFEVSIVKAQRIEVGDQSEAASGAAGGASKSRTEKLSSVNPSGASQVHAS